MKCTYFLLFSLLFSTAIYALSPITGVTDGCIGSVNRLSDSVGGGTWSSGNVPVATIGSLTGIVTGVSLGTTIITYTVSGASVTTVVTIHPYVTPSVSISTNTGDTICAGTDVTYTANPVNGGATPAYQWKLNHADASITDVYTGFPSPGDTVTVTMTSAAACASPDTAFAMIALTVLPDLIPSDSIGATPGSYIGGGEVDTLTAVAAGATSYTYQWVINSTPVPGATNAVYITDSLANNDSVTCIVVSVGRCGGDTAFNSISVTVGPSGIKLIAGQSDIQLFPNPNNGVFTLKGALTAATGTGIDNVDIVITDIAGRVVYSNRALATGGNINEQVKLNNIAGSGIYLLHLIAGNECRVIQVAVSGQ